MYQVVEPLQAEKIKAEHAERVRQAQEAVELLDDQRGSWLTEDEENTLSEMEKKELKEQRLTQFRITYFKEGNKFDDLIVSSLLAQTVPPSETYLAAKERLEALYREVTHHSEYFRLNVWGMEKYFEVMSELGMVKQTRESVEWPTLQMDDTLLSALQYAYEQSDMKVTDSPEQIEEAVRSNITSDSFAEYYGPESSDPVEVTDEAISLFVKHQGELVNHLSYHDANVDGIEDIKFSSNDGWWVTKEECASAMRVWDRLPEDVRKETVERVGPYWLLWIEYIENGAEGEGFTVH